MADPSPFQYAILRVVPSIERGESFNGGVILFCRPLRFLAARVALEESRLRAIAPDADAAAIRSHLDLIAQVAAGDPRGGPIAELPSHERFHWLVAPSSTIIQPAEVHTGLTLDPKRELEHLFTELVA